MIEVKDAAQKARHAAKPARFFLDLGELTVYTHDENGDLHDLNNGRAKIRTHDELRTFIDELDKCNAFSHGTAEELREAIPEVETKKITLHGSSKGAIRRAIKALHRTHWTSIEDLPWRHFSLGHHVTNDARGDYLCHAYVTVSLKPSGAVVRSERLVLNGGLFRDIGDDYKAHNPPRVLWNSGRGGTTLEPVTLV